jgi:F-type H+-transporting ATPase subunit a
MDSTVVTTPELPNFITLLADAFRDNIWSKRLLFWEDMIFSLIIAGIVLLLGYLASRKSRLLPSRQEPGRLQNAAELVVAALDNFMAGLLGKRGRHYLPFVGTLFIYILFMNLSGLIPFVKAGTSNWSVTLALALCVFVYVNYTAVKELGFFGYMDHLAGKPRGALAFTLIIPIMMFFMHTISELIKPISLSLRLRSNVWGDDVLLAVLSGFGIGGLPLLFFNMMMAVLMAVVQAVVFCILTAVYFVLVMPEEVDE